jgi:hypothetical protein
MSVGPQRDQRNHDRHGDQGRRDNEAHRLDPHHLKGIEFLADAHGADARRQGRPRTARDQDAGDQGCEFTGDREGHANDHLILGTEDAQGIDALDGEHHADGDRHHGDDRQGANADFHGAFEGRGDAHGLGPSGSHDDPEQHARENPGAETNLGDAADRGRADLCAECLESVTEGFERAQGLGLSLGFGHDR